MDWFDRRFFLELIRHGILSAAAQHLHVTQSTVGRQLHSLETKLGVRLVHRINGNYVLTARRHRRNLQAPCEIIGPVSGALRVKAAGRDQVFGPGVRRCNSDSAGRGRTMASLPHDSARTTPRVRSELRAAKESTWFVVARYGLNPRTVRASGRSWMRA